ncbi:MAG: hypothetical protein M1608_09520 [Candidatus Omnitrophica bacterium]|nr:hypothetical protein [Candidatus Omnitrophota bacterium]
MKTDRRTLLTCAAVVVGVVLWSAQKGRRPARAGGACCPLIQGLNLLPSNSWVAVESTNTNSTLPASGAITNIQR